MKFHELICGGIQSEAAQQQQRKAELHQRHGQRHAPDPLVIVAAQQQQRHGPGQRQERQYRQQVR